MAKQTLIVLGLWAALLVTAFPVAYYLASHPAAMLRMEETQPGSAVRHGKELLADGYTDEAIVQFQRGIEFYQKLHDESGLANHEIHMVGAMIAKAEALRQSGTSQNFEQALSIYSKAIEMYPRANNGLWLLSKGDVLQKAERFDEAIIEYSRAIETGFATARLFALYGRGRSHLIAGELDQACDDLYYFLRYRYTPLSLEQWEEFLPLSDAQNIRKEFILAQTLFERKEFLASLEHINRYLSQFPADRSARYYKTKIDDSEITPDLGRFPLADIFPSSETAPLEIYEQFFNLYLTEDGAYELSFSLSATLNSNELPQVTVHYLDQKATLFIASETPSAQTVRLRLSAGRNMLFLRIPFPGIADPPQPVLLHELTIKPTLE